jgi:hypothetical protein
MRAKERNGLREHMSFYWFGAAFLIGGLVSFMLVSTGEGGMEGVPAFSPSVWEHAAVNIVVLQYTSPSSESEYLSETAKQLSLLIHRNMLYSVVKYSPVGATQIVVADDWDSFQPDLILDKILGNQIGAETVIRPKHALIMLWGFLYEEGDDIYVQSYIRFLRRDIAEAIAFPLYIDPDSTLVLIGHLPSQAFAFAPRKLTTEDLRSINEEFEKNALVRERPDVSAPGKIIDPYAIGNYAYSVLEAHEEWMKIKPKGYGTSGWIHIGVDFAGADLREYLPELCFAEAMAGYLRSQMIRDGVSPSQVRTDWIRNAINQYRQATENRRRAPMSEALSEVIEGNLDIFDGGMPSKVTVTQAREHYAKAAALIPYNADAKNLLACAHIYLGLLDGWLEERPSEVASDLLYGVSLDPNNSDILGNLEILYHLMRMYPESDELLSSEMLDERISAVRQVREAQQR